MSRFPSLPRLVGETDDDNSIHLYDRVGPAKPLRSKNISPHDEVVNIFQDEQPLDTRNYEKAYQMYERTGEIVVDHLDLYYDDDLTDVESVSHEDVHASPIRTKDKLVIDGLAPVHPNSNTWLRKSLTVMGSGCIMLLIFSFFYLVFDPPSPMTGLPIDASKKFEKLYDTLSRLESSNIRLRDDQKKLHSQQDSITKNLNSITSSLNSKFEAISSRFMELEASKSANSVVFDTLKQELRSLEGQVATFLGHSDPEKLEAKLRAFDSKLEDVATITSDIHGIKKDIIQEVLAVLPSQIPVSIEEGSVKFQPEFRAILYSFIENYNMRHQEERMREIRAEVGRCLEKQQRSDNSISKESLELLIATKLESSELKTWQKVVNLIDELTLLSHDSALNNTQQLLFRKRANGILLDNFLEEFSDATLKINYADYSLGSRILGFLTYSGPPGTQKRSLLGKMVFGWYDYLTSSVPNPNQWKFNANNLLIDDAENWCCTLNECSVGIRLFNKIIPTDVVIQSDLDQKYTPPSKITIYVKPKTRKDKERLAKKLSELKFDFNGGNTPLEVHSQKYLAKYLKIKQFTVDAYKQTVTIPLPLIIVNLRIPIHDIYIQFECEEDTKCGISNVKVYGISELNYHRLDGKVAHVVDNIQARMQASNLGDQFVLGGDEVIF